MRSTCLGAVAVLAACAPACGGRLSLNENPAQEAGAALVDASLGVDAGSPHSDAAVPTDAPSDAAASSDVSTCWATMSACHACPPGRCDWQTASGCGGRFFVTLDDFLAFFSNLARQGGLVVPQHGVDCTASGQDAGLCTYDPREAQASATDLHYCNPDHEFIGPDGLSYIWYYKPDENLWAVATQQHEQALYALLLEWIGCIPGEVFDGGVCNHETCSGCCQGNVCDFGSEEVACGASGGVCVDCTTTGQACMGGACM